MEQAFSPFWPCIAPHVKLPCAVCETVFARRRFHRLIFALSSFLRLFILFFFFVRFVSFLPASMVGYGRAHGVGLGASAKPTAHLSAENERGVSGERKEEVRRAREPHHRHQSGFSHDKQSSVFFFFFFSLRLSKLFYRSILSLFFFFVGWCVCVCAI